MKTVRLGKTGLKVSRIGMGGIPITRPPEDEAIKVMQRAFDLGVNFVDTAVSYAGGISEERIGKAIADRRDEVFLATKGSWRDKDAARDCIERSLKRLNTDYIDLWQFHCIMPLKAYEKVIGPDGAMEAAQEALQEGKIRHIGFSTHDLNVALKVVPSGHFETVQFPFNFVTNEAADKLVPLAREHDVGFIAMKPFAGGRIRDANLAIKYLLQFDNVVPDPGIQKAEEIEEIVDIVNGSWELTPQERQEMEDIRARVGTRFCRQCGYCMPCPQGVFIPGVLYLKLLWGGWPLDWFLSWDYVQKSVESAKNCVQCGECEEKCPYHLPIREMIAENIKFYKSVAGGKA
jgi:predicted aldo/keto reductase-like oxidoreductase